MKRPSIKTFLLFLLSIFILNTDLFANHIFDFDTTLFQKKEFSQYGYDLYNINPIQSKKFFMDAAEYFQQRGDTTSYITCLVGLSDLEKRKGYYNRAFDILWDIQNNIVADNDYASQRNLHRRLGRLYGIYGKYDLALLHLKKDLEIGKRDADKAKRSTSYYAIAEQYVNFKDYESAMKYLDSCYLSKPGASLIYVDAIYGYSYLKMGNYPRAQVILNDLTAQFEKKSPAFLAKVYSFQAELRLALNEPDKAIYFYEKSLDFINTKQVHNEIKPQVLEQLALLYQKKGNNSKALTYLLAHKEISDSLFNTQSEQNKELFDIKSKFKEDLSEKEAQIRSKNKLLKLQSKAAFRLKLLLVILLLLIVIALITFRQRFQMRQLILEKKQNNALIEIKNKELTSNTLQFIEKENALNELLELIKEHVPEKYKSLNNQLKQSNKKIWDDFHMRFTQINSQFYDQLLELHPDLTQTDLKHCALIKLNFDSKEMSLILGISLHSVHVARSRIRKKLVLKREDSLSGYLGKI